MRWCGMGTSRSRTTEADAVGAPELPPEAVRAIRAGLPCTDTFPAVNMDHDELLPSLTASAECLFRA